MTGDLLIITPSRGRPANVARLLQTVHAQRRSMTHVHVATDSDDPELPEYERVFAVYGGDGDTLETGPRKSLTGWTNDVALAHAADYTCLASFGDDHIPRSKGFDRALVTACLEMGAGIAYPWDAMREDIPEAVVMSSSIVTALGWMCEPSLGHYFVDNVWAALGRGAGCLRHLRAIAVDHAHPGNGTASGDATYRASAEKIPADKAAYKAWRAERMAADVATVKALRASVLQPA